MQAKAWSTEHTSHSMLNALSLTRGALTWIFPTGISREPKMSRPRPCDGTDLRLALSSGLKSPTR